MRLDSMYQEIILDHYRHPHGRGLREPYEVEVHHVNPTCGDEVTLRVHLTGAADAAGTVDGLDADAADSADPADADPVDAADGAGGRGPGGLLGAPGAAGTGLTVADVSYDGQGCSISQASASVLHDLLVGREVAEALQVLDAFVAMVQSRGQAEPDEDVLSDAVAFAGVSRYPARVKCALLSWMAFKDATVQAVGRGAT